jgi:hypothetical protein
MQRKQRLALRCSWRQLAGIGGNWRIERSELAETGFNWRELAGIGAN